MKLDPMTVTYDTVDDLVDTDPMTLRDLAWAAINRARDLERDLTANEGSEDARLAIAETRLTALIDIRDELRAHVADLDDKQPWENRSMFQRLLAALETATKE